MAEGILLSPLLLGKHTQQALPGNPSCKELQLHGDFPAQGGTQQQEGSKAKSRSSVHLEGSSCTFLSAQEMTNADTR